MRLIDGFSGCEVIRLDIASGVGGRPFLFVHRADLVAALADCARAAGVRIETGAELVDLAQAPGGARLRFGDGDGDGGDGDGAAEHQAELVIGAEGLHSRLRARPNGKAAPAFVRQTARPKSKAPSAKSPAPTVARHRALAAEHGAAHRRRYR